MHQDELEQSLATFCGDEAPSSTRTAKAYVHIKTRSMSGNAEQLHVVQKIVGVLT
jgi:hypothetical protein